MKEVATLVLAIASLVACGGTDAKRVLFIGSDGMSAAILRRADVKAPTLRGLMARGAACKLTCASRLAGRLTSLRSSARRKSGAR